MNCIGPVDLAKVFKDAFDIHLRYEIARLDAKYKPDRIVREKAADELCDWVFQDLLGKVVTAQHKGNEKC